MDSIMSRRVAAGLVSGIALLAASPARVSGQVSSSGIGLPRAAVEGLYGEGSPGQTYMVYPEPMTGAEMHIGYSENELVDYIWIGFEDMTSGMGIPAADGNMLLSSLMPDDVRMREVFAAPETPGSLVSLRSIRWTSRKLGDLLDDRRSILSSLWLAPGPGAQGDMLHRLAITVETVFG